MTKNELTAFRIALEAKEQELHAKPAILDGIAVERTADEIDLIQSSSHRELTLKNLDLQHTMLRLVRAALQRIKDGSFGICLGCDEEIKPRRLQIVPWSECCVPCQEAADREAQNPGTVGLEEEAA